MRASFTRVFSAAHRVWNDPGKCQNIHGHNYRAVVEVEASELTAQGFALPFDAVKAAVDVFDHALVVDQDDPLLKDLELLPVRVVRVNAVPSTENLARVIANEVLEAAPPAVFMVAVALRETDGIEAFAEATR